MKAYKDELRTSGVICDLCDEVQAGEVEEVEYIRFSYEGKKDDFDIDDVFRYGDAEGWTEYELPCGCETQDSNEFERLSPYEQFWRCGECDTAYHTWANDSAADCCR